MKIAIVGNPKAGKTTLAKKLSAALGTTLKSSDDYKDHPWSEQPTIVAMLNGDKDNHMVEGVTVARALRYGYKPDVVIRLRGGDATGSIPKIINDRLASYAGKVVEIDRDTNIDELATQLRGDTKA